MQDSSRDQETEHASDRRRADRAAVRVEVDFRASGHKPFKVHIVDLSETGCRVDTLSKAHAGTRIWLTIGSMAAIEAIVRWSSPFGFGAEWVRPLHVSLVDHIRREQLRL